MAKKLCTLSKEFENPSATWRGMPFWAWNGELEEKELKRQVDIMKEMGFGGYYMHSRSGLITEYLGEEWFDLINKVTEYGTSVGMESWLYDEDRWPSGSAGGIVTRDPRFRKKSLYVFETAPENTEIPENTVAFFDAIFNKEDNHLLRYRKMTPGKKATFKAKAGEVHKVLKFAVVYDKPNNNYNGTTYIDTMMKDAVKKFLEVTHDEYRAHASDEIWAQIKGIFTDEPHRGTCLDDIETDENGYSTSPIFWTDDILKEFKKRYKYDVLPKLPELFYIAPLFSTSYKVKHDYIDLGDNLFLERFAKPIQAWCKKNNIIFTGHVLHEDSLTNQTVPQGSLMRFYEFEDQPGVDVLCAGNYSYWIAKQIQSSCRQLGKKRILSELYGCTGWQFNFKGHKNIGDWQALFGVNARCPHLSWYTMEGRSKRDYPASILHQATYYKDYAYVEDYFSRFGLIMTEGEPACDVLVINPIESVWLDAHAGWASWITPKDDCTKERERHYEQLFDYLASNQIDFDYGDEQMMAQKAKVETGADGKPVIRFGKMTYKCAVISGARTIRKTTMDLLSEFSKLGGRVVILGEEPEMVDCVPASFNDTGLGFIHAEFSSAATKTAVKDALGLTPEITGPRANKIFAQLRKNGPEGSYILALLNTDIRRPAGKVKIKVDVENVGAVEEWDLTTGKKYNARGYYFEDGKAVITTEFETGESKIYVFKKKSALKELKPDLTPATKIATALAGPFDYTLDEKNVMVIDFASAVFTDNSGKVTEIEDSEVLRTDAAVRKASGVSLSGGDGLQPWYSKKFHDEEYGDLKLRYTFNVETIPSGKLVLAAERPERIRYFLNGTELKADGGFWTDICLKTLPVDNKLLKKGENVIAAETRFKETTNVESLYLIGDFGVKAELVERNRGVRSGDKGMIYSHNTTITTLPKQLTTANLADQNLMFYTGCVSYKITPEQIKKLGNEDKRLLVSVSSFVGSLVKITDNEGNNKKVLGWEPYVADVTEYAETGFTVTLVCSRKNMFGPLHLIPSAPYATGPEHFTADGDCFTRDYVLMESRPGNILIKRS